VLTLGAGVVTDERTAMLQVREHGVDDYAALKDMDLTDVGVLDESDRACLREVGAYLTATDAWRRFAVWLLHKHFEPVDGEVFVERSLSDLSSTETTPIRRSAFATDGLSVSGLRFDSVSDSGVHLVGLEYAEPSDFGGVAALGGHDEAVLVGLAELLRSHGKLARFGIKLIRNPLALSEDQLLLETCDLATRIQYCDVSSRGAVFPNRSIIETTWRWRLEHGVTDHVVMQECTAGCTPAVGEGHVLGHRQTQFDNDDNPIDPIYP
jgi:hypothetical protein